MHTNWRDCRAWKDEGLTFNTTSNQASKLFDAALTQYVSWHEIDQLGGLGGTVNSMLNEDPNFILGHVLDIAMNLFNLPFLSNEMKSKLDKLNALHKRLSSTLSDREILHIDALNKLALGNAPSAASAWEEILLDQPNDLLAIKFAHDTYFYLGSQNQMRDSLSRVVPLWKPTTPLYNYLYGMWSFGFVQTNFFKEAELTANKSLEVNKHDAWATHTICHLNEYRNTYDNGIKFLRDTESDWTICNLIVSHNYWHLCLFHLERDEHEAALELYDEKIFPQMKKSDAYLDIVDCCSLLYRLKLDNANYTDRWSQLRDVLLKHVGENGFLFNDMHIFMCMSAANDIDSKMSFYKELNKYLDKDSNNNNNDNGDNYLKSLKATLGVNVYEAISYFDQNEYSKCVQILYPIRYELIKMGGSNAQRDMLHQLLTIAALKSNNERHNRIGIALLNERKALKPHSKLNQRIAARFASVHE